MAFVGIDIPDEPISDYQTYAIINTFWLVNRSRTYVSGMAISPLPLTVAQISDVLAVYPVAIDRHCLDKAIFAIDDLYLNMMRKDYDNANITS